MACHECGLVSHRCSHLADALASGSSHILAQLTVLSRVVRHSLCSPFFFFSFFCAFQRRQRDCLVFCFQPTLGQRALTAFARLPEKNVTFASCPAFHQHVIHARVGTHVSTPHAIDLVKTPFDKH